MWDVKSLNKLFVVLHSIYSRPALNKFIEGLVASSLIVNFSNCDSFCYKTSVHSR